MSDPPRAGIIGLVSWETSRRAVRSCGGTVAAIAAMLFEANPGLDSLVISQIPPSRAGTARPVSSR